MIWLLPAAGCSILIAVILKINEVRRGDRVVLAASNYIVASLLSLVLLLLKGGLARPPAGIVALGAVAGVDYVLGFLLLMAGIARGPLAVPVTVMRLSVAVPIVVSILVWSEQPGPLQWVGIVLGAAAILLFGAGIRDGGEAHGRRGYRLLIVSLFLVMGIGDVLLKTFRETGTGVDRLLFTFILFTVSCLFAWGIVRARRLRVERRTVLLGFLLGVPNLYSTIFMLRALRDVPASIAFPFTNLAVILGSTLLGLVVWRETLSRIAVAGLAVAALALVLLPLG